MKITVVDGKGVTWSTTIVKPPTKKYVGWRCLHAAEGGYPSDPRGMPEIRPAYRLDANMISVNPPPVIFNKPLQILSWQINNYNPLFTKGNWRSTYSTGRAFTNHNGFGETPDRRDWVTPKDLSNADPKLMKALICGGAFILDDSYDEKWIYCSPGISAIPANGPYPVDANEVFAKLWYFEATTQYYGKMSHFPQGHGKAVWIPYVLRETVKYPRSWFERWEEDYLPDPLKIYHPV